MRHKTPDEIKTGVNATLDLLADCQRAMTERLGVIEGKLRALASRVASLQDDLEHVANEAAGTIKRRARTPAERAKAYRERHKVG